jgi:16S rRNA (cytidine1402-2'-O)-methyltransferase
LESIADAPATVIAYESPHRILDTLADMGEFYGRRPIVLAREITKLHEEFLRGSAQEIRDKLVKRLSVKGEITLLIGAPEEAPGGADDAVAEVQKLETEEGLERMEAVKTVAKRLGLPKREIYRLCAVQDSNRADKRHD